MKWSSVLLMIVGMYTSTASAQRESYTVRPGENANVTLPSSVKFKYGTFRRGTVFFRDGTASSASLDYNRLSGEMQFISPNGDTMTLANEGTIQQIVVDKDTFYYDKGYLQLVAANAYAKLAKKEMLTIGDTKKAGGYGGVSSTSAISTISTLPVNGQPTNLTVQKEITLNNQTTFFIGNSYNRFLPATKKNVLRLFGKNQNQLELYLKENKTTFNNEEDLKALLIFLAEE